jgi:hypothetical protein
MNGLVVCCRQLLGSPITFLPLIMSVTCSRVRDTATAGRQHMSRRSATVKKYTCARSVRPHKRRSKTFHETQGGSTMSIALVPTGNYNYW